jgi:hypothetical protein
VYFTTEELISMLDPSFMDSPARIESLRRQEHERLYKIAMSIMQDAGVKEWVFHDNGLDGRAFLKARKIVVPTPTTPHHLYILARECWRIVFRNVTPAYVRDYQAARSACAALGNNGVPIPFGELAEATRDLAHKMCLAVHHGVRKFDERMVAWCGDAIWTEIQELSRQPQTELQQPMSYSGMPGDVPTASPNIVSSH